MKANRLLSILLSAIVVSAVFAAQTYDPDEIARICRTSLLVQDPVCQHGGVLRADNASADTAAAYLNCASCLCPEGWLGTDCGLCSSKDICPPKNMSDGTTLVAVNCTSASIEPTPEEYYTGKRFSCECGGVEADKSTQWVCQKQPGTNWDIFLLPGTSNVSGWYSGQAAMKVMERAGTPSQDYWPPCPTGVDCPTPERYRYAYPGVWDGEFQECSWSRGPCILPMTGEDCFVYTCQQSQVQCPSSNSEKCPGWTPISCGKPPGESLTYWSHHCPQSSYPVAGKAVRVACKVEKGPDNTFQCYITQEGAYVASIGMRCQTGMCIYNDTHPGPPAPAPPPPYLPSFKVKHLEIITLVLIAVSLLAVFVATFILLRKDQRQSEAWVKAWGAAGTTSEQLLAVAGDVGADEEGQLLLADGALPGGVGRVVLSWHQIQFSVQKASGHKKRILRGVSAVSGQPPASEQADQTSLFAILGPSGAGKTTLLDILAGRRGGPGLKGEVKVNGVTVSGEQMKDLAGYVMQDDVLPGTLSVWEYLEFHAALRLPEDRFTPRRRRARILQILEQLGLTKVAQSYIGDAFMRGLSGGEKRRVSIASELITNPGILFLDEPTTGLDSTNAAKVVQVLADLAAQGVNVVMSIHQPRPDMFRLMSGVLLLSGDGQVVYTGAVAAAGEYFSTLGFTPNDPSINMADYMLDVVIRSPAEVVQNMVDTFQRQSVNTCSWVNQLEGSQWALPAAKYRAPYKVQLKALSTRLLRNTYRHPFLIMLNFTATLVVAILLGLIFRNAGVNTSGIQNRLGVLFFMLLYLSLMSLSSLPIWREEKLLFLRERDSGAYGTPAYFAAVVLFDLIPMRMVPPVFFALFSYWLIGLHINCTSCILWFIAILVLSNVVSTTMCMAIGAGAPSNSVANLAGSLLILLLLLFGGFLVNRDSIPPYCLVISGLSFFNYAYEALAVNEFHHAPVDFNFTAPIDSSKLPPIRVSGDGVLKEFGFKVELFYFDVFMLIFIGALCTGIAYVFLYMSGHSIWNVLFSSVGRSVRCITKKLALAVRSMPGGSWLAAKLVGMIGGREIRGRRGTPSRDISPSSSGMSLDCLLLDETTQGEVNEVVQDQLHHLLARASPTPHRIRAPSGALLTSDLSTPALQLAITAGTGGLGPEAPIVKDPPMTLSWENITCRVRTRQGHLRTILHAVSGVAGVQPAPSASIRASQEDGQVVAASPTHGHANGVDGLNHESGSPSRKLVPDDEGSCLFAILGPSGAGKTTLLDILAGRKRDGVTGEIRANGHLVSSRTVRHISGYVLQDDILPGTSTVWEYLMFHAKLRLPTSLSPDKVQSRVALIIHTLALDKVAHQYIGDAFVRGLSGGERRRVSIASELITNPGILFLDEPTTGLDSTNAVKVVDIMSDLAHHHDVTVIMSIHQPRPDILRLMNRICILSGEGQVVFTGPTSVAEEYFSSIGFPPPSPSVNIADHILDLVIRTSSSEVDRLVKQFRGSQVARRDEAWLTNMMMDDAMHSLQRSQVFRVLKKYESSYWRQLLVLSGRLGRHTYRHPLLILLNFGAAFVMSLGIGIIYWKTGRDTGGIQDRLGALFFMCIYLSLISLSSLPVWRDERLLFIRERAAGVYGTAAYFTAVALFDLIPMRVLPPVFFTLISYRMIGLRGGHWTYPMNNLGLLVLTNMTAASLNMAIGAASPNVAIANMIASLAMLTSTLFGGFLLSRGQMPRVLSYFSNLTYIRYAYESLVINEFHGATGFRFTGFHQPGQPPDKIPFVEVTGDIILGTFGFRTDTFWTNTTVLFLLLGVYLTATFFLLRYKGRI